ncbi:MAG: hypothetical protein RLZZ67_217 [Candidatus Parcubacteria bacterium]|jgi:sec-independent protein translocase protein TatC
MLNPDSEWREKLDQYAPYFQDLFRRLYILTICFIVFFGIGFFSSAPILRFATYFFDFKDVVLATTSPFQLVDLAMDVGLFFAGVCVMPLILYHFYTFIGGGLRKVEKKVFFLLLPFIVLLFLFGFAYSFSILYFAMQALADLNVSLGVKNLWNISLFLSQIVSTSAWLGLIFEFPIAITFLIKLGFMDVGFLKGKRRHAVFGMFLLTSLLPPTDGISLIMMVLPLVVMYEATIMYNRIGSRQLVT